MFVGTIIMSIMVTIIQYQRAKIDKSKGKYGCSLPEIKVRVNYMPFVGLDCIYTVEKVHVHCDAAIIGIQTPSSAATVCTAVPQAHIFLEKACEAVTWVDMRATLKAIDIDFDKTMSLSEFFVFERKLDWKKLGEDQIYYIYLLHIYIYELT